MTQQGATKGRDTLIEEWHSRSSWQRFLLPSDFLDNVSAVSTEEFDCHKTTVEYLTMSDRVEAKTLTTSESTGYSRDLSYRPKEFKNETIRILSEASDERCGQCRGAGLIACDNCFGNGRIPCPRMMDCRECGETGRTRGRCLNCGGSGRATCDECAGTGRVDCDECNVDGNVECPNCDGEGNVVQGNLITRCFSHSTQVYCKLGDLPVGQYKNGLVHRHFQSIEGDIVRRPEFQKPARADIVLQRLTVHKYNVMSSRYQYNDKEFCLNRIVGGGCTKFVPMALPLSGMKVGVAALVLSASVVAISLTTIIL